MVVLCNIVLYGPARSCTLVLCLRGVLESFLWILPCTHPSITWQRKKDTSNGLNPFIPFKLPCVIHYASTALSTAIWQAQPLSPHTELMNGQVGHERLFSPFPSYWPDQNSGTGNLFRRFTLGSLALVWRCWHQQNSCLVPTKRITIMNSTQEGEGCTLINQLYKRSSYSSHKLGQTKQNTEQDWNSFTGHFTSRGYLPRSNGWRAACNFIFYT